MGACICKGVDIWGEHPKQKTYDNLNRERELNGDNFAPMRRTPGAPEDGMPFPGERRRESSSEASTEIVCIEDGAPGADERRPFSRSPGPRSVPPPDRARSRSPTPGGRARAMSREERKEEFATAPDFEDFTNWAQRRFLKQMDGLEFDAHRLRVTSVDVSRFEAGVDRSSGRAQLRYNLDFEIRWKGDVQGDTVAGILKMEDIIPDEQESEWYFEVMADHQDRAHKTAAKAVKAEKEMIVDNVHKLLRDMTFKAGDIQTEYEE